MQIFKIIANGFIRDTYLYSIFVTPTIRKIKRSRAKHDH